MSEREIAASLLLVERRSLPKLRAAVQVPSDRAALALLGGALTPVGAMVTLRREADDVENLAYGTLLDSRRDARVESRKKQSAALIALLLLARKKGASVDLPTISSSLASDALAADAASAAVAARSLASAWGHATMSKYQSWRSEAAKASRTGKAGSKASEAANAAATSNGGPYRASGVRADGYEGLATEIKKIPTVLEPRVARITVTEVASAHNDEARRVYDELPRAAKAVIELQWSAILDARTCASCEELDGQLSVDGEFPDGPPPIHSYCVPPGTMIDTPYGPRSIESLVVGDMVIGGLTGIPRKVVETHISDHNGSLVKLRCGSASVDVTGNHPVLTKRGWIEANGLIDGDRVFSHDRDIGVVTTDTASTNSKSGPAKLADSCLFDIVEAQLPLLAVPVAGVDFDGSHPCGVGEVNIEPVNVELGYRTDSSESELFVKESLQSGLAPGLKSCMCRSQKCFVGHLRAPSCVVGGSNEPGAPVGPFTPHTYNVCVGPVSLLYPVLAEPSVDNVTAYPESPGYLQNGELLLGEHGNNCSKQTVIDSAHKTSLDRACELYSWQVSATHIPYAGKVFNIGVDTDESYVANGLVVHNCRCIQYPVRKI